MKLLLVLGVCTRDCKLASDWLTWFDELGGARENDFLLVFDAKLAKPVAEALAEQATPLVKRLHVATTPFSLPDETWPIGANWMFETALRWMQTTHNEVPFLWLEPDCVLMRETAIGEIEREYERVCERKAFLGQIVKPKRANLPEMMLSGIGVYPANAPESFLRLLQVKRKTAWDVLFAPTVVPKAQHSLLFWNFWGPKADAAPTFVEERTATSPANALPLSAMPKSAAIAHRCKDGSLIDLMRQRQGGSLLQVLLKWKHSKGRFARIGPMTKREPVIWHCVERHACQGDAQRRVMQAFDSWMTLYKTGKVRPVHYWFYRRDSRALSDDRALPYLKDVLCEALNRANDRDIVMLTNDDTILHRRLPELLLAQGTRLPVCSFRVNIKRGQSDWIAEPLSVREGRAVEPADLGRDMFAFRADWLKRYWSLIPDFLLGELEWDLVLSVMVRQAHGLASTRENLARQAKPAEIDLGYVLHEEHERRWTKPEHEHSASKTWNRKLMFEWYGDQGLHSLITGF